jgi:hypothetical protein
MDSIREFFNQDMSSFIISAFVLIFGIVSMFTIIEKFSLIINRPVKWLKVRNTDHELLTKTVQDLTELHNKHEEDTQQSIRHDEMIREDLRVLTNTVNNISDRLDTMQSKIDATEMTKLKEKILGYYRKYKDIGEWRRFESDVFWELYDRYISHGGNSFVKHDIEPIMRSLRVIDE